MVLSSQGSWELRHQSLWSNWQDTFAQGTRPKVPQQSSRELRLSIIYPQLRLLTTWKPPSTQKNKERRFQIIQCSKNWGSSRHIPGILGDTPRNPSHVGKTRINQPWLGMVAIPPIKMVMTGGWYEWHCFTHISVDYTTYFLVRDVKPVQTFAVHWRIFLKQMSIYGGLTNFYNICNQP